MAVTAVFRTQSGTAKTIKSSGGDAAITLASLANGSYQQSATLDLGATRARAYRVDFEGEFVATPTAGNTVDLYGSWGNATGAGRGNTSGSDASYTGYSSDAAASVKELEFLGSHVCVARATTTVQKSNVGVIFPKGRYLNLVLLNGAGSAFHSSDSNCCVILTPIEDVSEPS